jgi:hypothetical protein
MLIIKVKEQEFFDEQKSMFFIARPITVRMEHSLISVSKWEANWEKSYFSSTTKHNEHSMNIREELDYISCMIIGEVPDYICRVLMQENLKEIREYINKPHTATTIYRTGQGPLSRKTITAELIYSWMIDFGIPFECEKWHLNRLLMLIDVCNVRQDTGKDGKMSAAEAAKYRHQMNRMRQSARKQ